MNKCFGAPVFEGKRVITIPSNTATGVLPDFAVVQVTFNKNCCLKIDGINVTMRKNKNWIYQVSSGTDPTAPSVPNGGVTVYLAGDTNRVSTSVATLPATPWQTGNNNIYNNEKKLGLKVHIYDGGVGPADKFTIRMEKVLDNNYKASNKTYEKSIYFQQVKTTEAFFTDNNVDLSDLNLDDGVYKTSFIFRDKSGNDLTYPEDCTGYYFTVDNAITMAAPTITDTTDSSGLKFRLDWDPPLDCVETIIRCKKNGTQIYSHTFTNTNQHTKEYSLPDLDTNYSFEISNKDMFGHTQSLTVSEKSASFDRIIVSGTPEKTFYCSGETFDKTGLTVTAYLSKNKSWQTTNYSTDLGTAINVDGKTVNVSYTYYGVTKTAAVQNSTYYVVASDALTQSPVQITGHSNPIYATYLGPQTYYKFGDYPQTIAADNITFSSAPVYNGWYLGSDGYLYEKCIENLCAYYSPEHNYDESYGYVYSNGQRVKWEFENSYRYFKVEPIIWRVISNSYNGKKLLLSEKVIDATKWYYYFDYNREMSWEWISEDQPSLYKRNFNGKDILPSNYKYSTIRAFLNGKYETGDQQPKNYENNGFLQKAFTKTAQDFIKEVQIDNSIASVRPTNYNNLSSRDKEDFYTATSWICDDVVDKVFLLSVNEMTNPEYGFKIYGDADWAKEILVTDYSKANNVEYQYGGSCDLSWLRSPRDGDNVFVFDNYIYFRYSYDIDLGGGYEYGSYGIAPALCIEP